MNFKIGVDGGGTKTECILVDARGAIVARHIAPGCNPNHGGPEKARKILHEALQTLLSQSKVENQKSKITATLLCMAGSRSFWKETAAALSGYGHVATADDSLPVLELATGGAPGLALHAGTGSFVAARAPDGSVHYAGGLGWRLGDPGSGYDLGRRAIAHALLELQGWRERTALSAALEQYTSLSDAGAITRYFYAEADAGTKIAAFAPRVMKIAANGNAAAQQIIAESLAELAGLVDHVLARLFSKSEIPLGVSGALLNSPPAVHALRALAETRGWRVDCRFLTEPPSEGVRRLLAKM